MNQSSSQWKEERARLARTLGEINRRLEEIKELVESRREKVVATRTSMWEDLPRLVRSFDDAVELAQNQQILDQQERDWAFYAKFLPQLERMADSPYFGRIDFAESDGKGGEAIYIGIAGLTEAKSDQHLIYDWRAPISSMFYDFEPGPASYPISGGKITGRLLLKRQYKIEEGTLRYLFDTDLKIDDDILQDILGHSADTKMKVIVQTIQREQNQAIRDERHRLLIVQGPAGSGKTSIALHRVAYFLYRFRQELSPENIVVFSPNQIFGDYISDVLPELGEENVRQATMRDWITRYLPLTTEDVHDQLEFLLSARGSAHFDVRAAGIAFKSSPQFRDILRAYVDHLTSGAGLPFSDIIFNGKIVITGAEMLRLLREEYSYLPLQKRIDKVIRRVLYLLEPLEEHRLRQIQRELEEDPELQKTSVKELRRLSRLALAHEVSPIKEKINGWNALSSVALYKALFSDRELLQRLATDNPLPAEIDAVCTDTLERLAAGAAGYEDAAPLLFLESHLGEVEPDAHIRHVVVDEAQDYSLLHYEVIKELYPHAAFTILGDLNQRIHPIIYAEGYQAIQDVFATAEPKVIRLTKSYRSTGEIVAFTKRLLGEGEPIEGIERKGAKPQLIQAPDNESLAATVAAALHSLQRDGMRSVGIICKTDAESRELYHRLPHDTNVHLVSKDDLEFYRGVTLIPSYLAKGLEFDAVIIADAGRHHWSHPDERKLLYTACTRALHRLVLCYTDHISPLLQGIPADLFTAHTGSAAKEGHS